MRLFFAAASFLLGSVLGEPNLKPLKRVDISEKSCGGWHQCLDTQMEGMEDNNGPLLWFEGWNSTVQPKLEHLLATSLSRQQQDQSEGNNQRRWSKDHGLEIVMAGDSTIIQQFQVLSEFVYLRSDFYRVTGDNAEIRQKYELTFGAPRNKPGSVTFLFFRVFEGCMISAGNPQLQTAHALYFGCGMHLLHLLPVQSPPALSLALNRWTFYDTFLTEKVEDIRNRNPDIKLLYMTTHTIDEAKYTEGWTDALKGYENRDPFYMDACKSKFEEVLPKDSPARKNIEQTCIDTVFGARAVKLLNDRGVAAMNAAGVAVMPAHTVVSGQSWATPVTDGRHYRYLVPVEVFMFLNTLEVLP